MNEYFVGNRGGVICVNATLTTAGSSSSDALYTLPNNTFRNTGAGGIIVITIDTATAAATGVDLQVNGSTLPLNSSTNEALTSIDAGVHIVEFNKYNNTLKLIV